MKQTVGELSKACGISVRTLHYYDEIGLLSPAETTEAGYRLYGEREAARLSQILFFRELDFPLGEIKRMLGHPCFDEREALRNQKGLLILKRDRLQRLIGLVDTMLEGGAINLKAFDDKEIRETTAKYAKEAELRWGGTGAWREYKEKAARLEEDETKRLEINGEAEQLFSALASLREKDPGDPEVQELVRAWQDHITRNYYTCTDEILKSLGAMYEEDERFRSFYDGRYGEGTAAFFRRAIDCRRA